MIRTEKGNALFSSAIENLADVFQVFLNASWEIDLWGKLRRAKGAARTDLLNMAEGQRAVVPFIEDSDD